MEPKFVHKRKGTEMNKKEVRFIVYVLIYLVIWFVLGYLPWQIFDPNNNLMGETNGFLLVALSCWMLPVGLVIFFSLPLLLFSVAVGAVVLILVRGLRYLLKMLSPVLSTITAPFIAFWKWLHS